jgi:hypothetical protein
MLMMKMLPIPNKEFAVSAASNQERGTVLEKISI